MLNLWEHPVIELKVGETGAKWYAGQDGFFKLIFKLKYSFNDDKCDQSEVITEFGILFHLFIIITNYNILSPSFNAFYVLCNQD